MNKMRKMWGVICLDISKFTQLMGCEDIEAMTENLCVPGSIPKAAQGVIMSEPPQPSPIRSQCFDFGAGSEESLHTRNRAGILLLSLL